MKKEEWIESRMAELLPVKYFHMVFTLPHELNTLVMGNRKSLYNLLLETSWYTLQKFSKDEKYLGATPGVISVLHTWGQQLSFHPHVHCIVSGGGVDSSGSWKDAKKSAHQFLFPTMAMAVVYKARFIKRLQELKNGKEIQVYLPENERCELIQKIRDKTWVVYAKQPFGGPAQVVEYLGRYTHKVAISNHRIKKVTAQDVIFNYKDYGDGGTKKQMSLNHAEFIRRFEQHILPRRFVKIRSYGYVCNRNRHARITALLRRMDKPAPPPPVKNDFSLRMLSSFGINVHLCPNCKKGKLVLFNTVFKARDHPILLN